MLLTSKGIFMKLLLCKIFYLLGFILLAFSNASADYIAVIHNLSSATWYRFNDSGQVLASVPLNTSHSAVAYDRVDDSFYMQSAAGNLLRIQSNGTVTEGMPLLMNIINIFAEGGNVAVVTSSAGISELRSFDQVTGQLTTIAQLPVDLSTGIMLFDQPRGRFYYTTASLPLSFNSLHNFNVLDINQNTTTTILTGLTFPGFTGVSSVMSPAIEPITGSIVGHIPTFPYGNFTIGALFYLGNGQYQPFFFPQPASLSYSPATPYNGNGGASISNLSYVLMSNSYSLQDIVEIDLVAAFNGLPNNTTQIALPASGFPSGQALIVAKVN